MTIDITFSQLTFQINNVTDPTHVVDNTIYTTDYKNMLNLVITTNKDGTGFKPSSGPVPLKQAESATGSLLYFDLSPLNLTTADIDISDFSATGWKFQLYGTVVCMYVVGDLVTMNSSDNITIQIKGLALPNPPTGPTIKLNVTYFHVVNINLDDFATPTYLNVVLQAPPRGNRSLYQDISFNIEENNTILASSSDFPNITNSLTFEFSPGIEGLQVKADESTLFTVSFVYDDADKSGLGALTTSALAKQITCNSGTNTGSWTITSNDNNLTWTLQPLSGMSILGTGAQAVADFTMNHIVTPFQPGPTLMILSYTGIPGYEPGSYYVVLEKVGHAEITSLTVSPVQSALNEDKTAQVTLNWVTAHAETLQLISNGVVLSPTGISWTGNITESTQFTLTAIGKNPANITSKSIIAHIKPVINSFTANPQYFYINDFKPPENINVAWDVNTNKNVDLLIGSEVLTYKPTGSTVLTVTNPETLTLEPKLSSLDDFSVQQSLDISTFSFNQRSVVYSSTPVYQAIYSPDHTFIAIIDETGLICIDSIGYQHISPNFSAADLLLTPPILNLLFSPDGKYILILSENAQIAIVQVTLLDEKYNWKVLDPITITASICYQFALSLDGNYLYVTCDDYSDNSVLLVLEKQNNETPFIQSTIPSILVGYNPAGIAVSTSHIFVGCTNEINVISYSGKNFILKNKIDISQANNIDLVLISNPGIIYNLIIIINKQGSGAGQVAFINAENPYTYPIQYLKIDAGSNAVVIPNSNYFIIMNGTFSGANHLALVKYNSETSSWTIIEEALNKSFLDLTLCLTLSLEKQKLLLATYNFTSNPVLLPFDIKLMPKRLNNLYIETLDKELAVIEENF